MPVHCPGSVSRVANQGREAIDQLGNLSPDTIGPPLKLDDALRDFADSHLGGCRIIQPVRADLNRTGDFQGRCLVELDRQGDGNCGFKRNGDSGVGRIPNQTSLAGQGGLKRDGLARKSGQKVALKDPRQKRATSRIRTVLAAVCGYPSGLHGEFLRQSGAVNIETHVVGPSIPEPRLTPSVVAWTLVCRDCQSTRGVKVRVQ